MAGEGLMKSADVPGLDNRERTPVVVTLSCLLGRFERPGVDSLGELLVLHGEGGAAAVWAPSGMSANHVATALGRTLFEARYDDGISVLGYMIGRSLADQRDASATGDHATYNLLGDPAMVLAGTDVRHTPLGTYNAWAMRWFGGPQGGVVFSERGADPDGDGMSNLVEYALNWDPKDPEGASALTPKAGQPLEITYTRRRGAHDIGYRVEWSADLEVWHRDTAKVRETVRDDGNGVTETVELRVVPSPGRERLFLRLRIHTP
jgi:hypothetical protein